jgi:hypothetical protein
MLRANSIKIFAVRRWPRRTFPGIIAALTGTGFREYANTSPTETGRATGNRADIDSNTGALPRTRGLPPVREVAVSRAAMSWDFKIATAT